MRQRLAPDFASRRKLLADVRYRLIKCQVCDIVDVTTTRRQHCRFCDGAIEPLHEAPQ